MLTTTTDTLDGHEVAEYLGIVMGEAILGANVVRDLFAAVTDFIGGRSGAYEEILARSRKAALDEMSDRARMVGADAVIGVDLDYETVGARGGMLMVTCAGTAVRLK